MIDFRPGERLLQTSVELDFDSNTNLGGTLPAEFGSLSQLTSLDIDSGTFSGTIPESLYQLTNLEALDIDLNQFTGTLSPSIGNLVNLNVLQIDSNAFTGPVPTEINQLENLSELVISLSSVDDGGFHLTFLFFVLLQNRFFYNS